MADSSAPIQGRSIEELTTPRPVMMPPPDLFDADLVGSRGCAAVFRSRGHTEASQDFPESLGIRCVLLRVRDRIRSVTGNDLRRLVAVGYHTRTFYFFARVGSLIHFTDGPEQYEGGDKQRQKHHNCSALRKIATSATTPAATAETTVESNVTKIDQNLKGLLKGILAASAVIPTPMNRLNRTTNAASNRIDHLPRDVRGIDKTR